MNTNKTAKRADGLDIKCRACASATGGAVSCKVGKNGKVYFQVYCGRCGSYSHDLVYGQLNRAVENLLKKMKGKENLSCTAQPKS